MLLRADLIARSSARVCGITIVWVTPSGPVMVIVGAPATAPPVAGFAGGVGEGAGDTVVAACMIFLRGLPARGYTCPRPATKEICLFRTCREPKFGFPRSLAFRHDDPENDVDQKTRECD